MINTCLVFGFIGIVLFIIILLSFNKLLKRNESGFLHLLMTLMYLCWLSIPIVVFLQLQSYSYMIIGTIFGTLSLLLLIITMIFQASHLSYSAKHNEKDKEFWDKNDRWMMNGLLGSQVELLANVLKGIWIVFLTIAFWMSNQVIFGILGGLYSIISIAYFFMLVDVNLVKDIPFFKKFKLNFIFINIETFSWYIVILTWILLNR